MDFRLQTSKKQDKNSVSVPKQIVERIIDTLSNVECTCVWDPRHKEYIRVADIDPDIVENLKTSIALSALAAK